MAARTKHGVADRGVAPSVGLALHRLRHRGGGVLDHLFGDPVSDLYRAQQVRGCRRARWFGSDMIAIRVTICCCSVLASGEPAPSTSAHPEQRRRFGARQGDHRGAQLGLGQVGAAGDQDLLHRHLPARPDGSAQPLRLRTDLLTVDAHRCVDHILGGQQDRRVGGHPVAHTDAVGQHLVQQRLAAVQQGAHRQIGRRGPRRCRPAGSATRTCGRRSSSWPLRRRVRWSWPAARRPAPTCIS